MGLIKSVKWAVAALCLTAFAGAVTQARAEAWIRAESDHFIINSNAPEKKTRAYIKKLEAFRTLTNMLLGAGDGPPVKFEIYLLNNGDQMLSVRPYFSPHVAGVYFNSGEGTSAYAALQNGGDILEDQDQSLIVLFHEYSHYVMFQHARTYYPTWYVEGFAEYLSTADPDHGQISIGEPSKGRNYTLAEDRWIDFARVLKPDFGFTGDKKNDPWEIESFYAQSWLLTHYMLSDNARSQALNAYFAKVGQGEDPVKSWEATTGIKVNELHGLLARYQQKMYYLKVPVADYPDASIHVTALPADEDPVILDGSLLTTGVDASQGKALLAKLQGERSALGNDPVYRHDLARAEMLFGTLSDAEGQLNAMLAADPADFQANYLLGRVYMKEADAKSGDDRNNLIDNARASFIAAYKINKLDAANLFYLARSFSDKPGFPDKNAVNAANGAHVLAPGVMEYATFAAFTDLATDQRDQAIALLTPFVSDPHNREQAERIKTAIDAIKAGKSTSEVSKLMSGGGGKN